MQAIRAGPPETGERTEIMAAPTAVLTRSAAGKTLVASSHAEFRARTLKGLAPVSTPTREAAGGADALLKLESGEFDTLYLDAQIEDLNVEELVATIHLLYPQLSVIVLDGQNDSEQFPADLSGISSSPIESHPVDEESVIE